MMGGRDYSTVSDAGDLVLSAGKGFLVQHSVTKFAAKSVGRVEGVDIKRIQYGPWGWGGNRVQVSFFFLSSLCRNILRVHKNKDKFRTATEVLLRYVDNSLVFVNFCGS